MVISFITCSLSALSSLNQAHLHIQRSEWASRDRGIFSFSCLLCAASLCDYRKIYTWHRDKRCTCNYGITLLLELPVGLPMKVLCRSDVLRFYSLYHMHNREMGWYVRDYNRMLTRVNAFFHEIYHKFVEFNVEYESIEAPPAKSRRFMICFLLITGVQYNVIIT